MQQILSIQILRAIAALSVVIAHVGINVQYWGGYTLPWTLLGLAGVDLFFVISGFIMVVISWDAFGQARAPADFVLRRLVRIVPLYWLITALFIAFGSYGIGHVAGSVLFYDTGQYPIVAVGWTLNFEMMFYAAFAACLWLPRNVGLLAIAGIMAALAATGNGDATSGPPAFNNTIVVEFVLGMAVGAAYRDGVRLSWPMRAVLVLAGVALLVRFGQIENRFLYFGAPSILIVAGAALGRPLPAGKVVCALAALGDASYALYLTNPQVTRLFATAMRSAGVDFTTLWPLYAVLSTAASIGVALLIYRFVEAPLLERLRRLARSRAASTA